MTRGIATTALYTFGSPRVGDQQLSINGLFDARPERFTALYRFVNAGDLVTAIPDSGFEHACEMTGETHGLVYLSLTSDIDYGGQSAEYNAGTWRRSLLERVGEHSIANYATKLLRFAGKAPPPSTPSGARARRERIRAAFVAPSGPQLTPVAPTNLPPALAHELTLIPGGARVAYAWTFEGEALRAAR